MIGRRAMLNGLALGAAACLAPSARAETKASAWAPGMSSRMRLAEAGPADAQGLHVAVVEIALDKGFKTYWRTPGDSGVPPVFSFDGSQNARDIAVHFPAPVRFDDGAGGHSIGYLGPLVEWPVTFRAIAPDKPVKLAVRLDYAVCEKICIPSSGRAELLLPPQKAIAPRAVRLLAGLPLRQPLKAAAPLAVHALAKGPQAEHFLVEAALPPGATGELFVEAASPWLFDVKGDASAGNGRSVFTVMAIDKDKSPECRGVEVTLTLIGAEKAVETTTWLDVSLLSA